MIKFSLKCAAGHRFDSWFQSTAAFDKLSGAGMIACVECGSTDVVKSLMTPSVSTAAEPAKTPANKWAEAIARLRREVEANSDDVGTDFARQARDMHEGHAPRRAIHGQARPTEARKLLQDGVPVLPLPFRPSRKLN